MTMPSTGVLNMGGTSSPVSVNFELGNASPYQQTVSMNDAAVRTLAGVGGSGTTWSMNSLYGKSSRVAVTVTISASTQNYIANTAKVTGYSAGKTDVTFVINSGVVIGSASTGSYAFTVNTSWAAGDTVTVTNAGTVIGAGGNGGVGSSTAVPAANCAGSSGGPAVSVARTITWTNTGTCGGGGGGGGGGAYSQIGSGGSPTLYGGGGGGGGRGNTGGSGGAGGSPNKVGSGSPGTAGTTTTAGTGGAGESGSGGTGGNGGALGSAGSAGNATAYNPGAGGAAGACLVGKSFVNGGAGITGGTTAGGQS